jgi:hypothetical protein
MLDIRIVPRTTQRKETADQETQAKEAETGTLDLAFAYLLNTIGKILFP